MTSFQAIDLGLGHIRVTETQRFTTSPLGSTYGPPEGFLPLRDLIAQLEKVTIQEVCVTTGASMGIMAALATLERPCSILCPLPYYPAYRKIADILGFKVLYYDLKKEHSWDPDPLSLARKIKNNTRAIILNFPNNPTGSLPDGHLLEQIKRIISGKNILVISDEVYADFVYEKAMRESTISSVFGREQVVRIKSFSKVLGIPGERLGYAIASPRFLRSITRAHWAMAMSPPATAQLIAYNALKSDIKSHISLVRSALYQNCQTVLPLLQSCNQINVLPPKAGVFYWIEILGTNINSETLAHECATSHGVTVVPGSAFGVAQPAYFRVSFAVPREELLLGFERMINFFQSLQQTTHSAI